MLFIDTELFNIILSIVSLTIGTGVLYFIKYINIKIGNDNLKKYLSLAESLVKAIEQTYPNLSGLDKKELAMRKLLELTYGKITPAQADILIESAVYELKKVLKDTNLLQ